MILTSLLIILLIVFLAPFFSRRIERNLEAFLFVMGLSAALVSRVLDFKLAEEALVEPIKISLAVLVFGMVFKYTREYVHHNIQKVLRVIPLAAFVFLMVVFLGIISSLITAIIASLFLVEIISGLKLSRKKEIALVVITCFSIGLGAALTPVGEPLSTIAIGKLKGEPHNADFFFLFRLLVIYIIPGIIGLGVLATLFLRRKGGGEPLKEREKPEAILHVFGRAGKTYLFVMALVLLGSGFKPLIDTYVVHWGSGVLYWVNMVSAILDNATLTAAEISPSMETLQIKSALMGLLISGGMLIPGNIPNIISAGKLKITSREWARIGVPLGLAMMVIYFLILEVIS